jgi:hypothetical protein
MRHGQGTAAGHRRKQRRLRPVPMVAAFSLVAAGGALIPMFANGAVAGPSCTVKYTAQGHRHGDFRATVAVTNNGKPVAAWTLTFGFTAGQKVTRGLTGVWSQQGSTVTVKSAAGKGSLATGAKATATFLGHFSARNPAPTRFALNGVACGGSAPTASASPSPSSAGAAASASASASPSGKPTASAAASAPASASPSASASATAGSSSGSLAQKLTVSKVTLPAALGYLQSGYNEMAEWTRVDTETAPDGTLRVAWPASDGVHVTPLTSGLARQGADTVVPGTTEVSGLVAQNDGFALLTRVPDSNKWGDTAAALFRYRNGSVLFEKKLTGTASNDSAPVLAGALKWNGSEYGAYFVVHGAGGFADGHYGDKLVYVNDAGTVQSGGWDWGCSHNEGIALAPAASGAFTSLCFDDWRSGLFVSTSIGAPDEAPVVQREQCWAGYCGGAYPESSGDLVKSATGEYATAFGSRGATAAVKNSADTSGRGWTVTPATDTHQVEVAFLKDGSTPGSTVQLTSDPGTDNVDVHLAPYGKNLLVTWESVTGAVCKDGTCTGKFGGTHLEVIDYNGKVVTADQVVDARIAGDIAILPDGGLAWAFAAATPDYSSAMNGASPTTTTLSIAHLAN